MSDELDKWREEAAEAEEQLSELHALAAGMTGTTLDVRALVVCNLFGHRLEGRVTPRCIAGRCSQCNIGVVDRLDG